MKIVVVGGGMQGRVIAKNLQERGEKPEVTIADIVKPSELPAAVPFVQADILDTSQSTAISKTADAIVLAVPSKISHAALTNVIKAGKPVVDVSFTPKPPLELDSLARASGACCVIDCGVAPGLSHILTGRAFSQLGGLDSLRILVGGIPQEPPPVFRHAIYFNAHDLIDEYIRPAHARKNGNDMAPIPIDLQTENFCDAEFGNLEAFLSDGLRSLLTSYPNIRDMAEFTLRWPGHFDTMRTLYSIGLLDDGNTESGIVDTLNRRYSANSFPDLLIMVVEAQHKSARRIWRLVDRRTDGESAMSRTTGFTAAAVAMILTRRQFTEPGIHPPERLGHDPRLTEGIINDLKTRGIYIRESDLAQ